IESLRKVKVMIPPAHVFGARSAAGRPAKKTTGRALAATNGTRLIQVESAPAAFISGLKLNAFLVAAGRHTRSGTRSDCNQGAPMVRVSVLYPNRADTKFDMTYYLNHHIPMVRRLLGSALKGVSVEHGISGEEPGSTAPYIATGHLLFDSVQGFQAS